MPAVCGPEPRRCPAACLELLATFIYLPGTPEMADTPPPRAEAGVCLPPGWFPAVTAARAAAVTSGRDAEDQSCTCPAALEPFPGPSPSPHMTQKPYSVSVARGRQERPSDKGKKISEKQALNWTVIEIMTLAFE